MEYLPTQQANLIAEFHVLMEQVVTIDDMFPPEDGVSCLRPVELLPNGPSSAAISLKGIHKAYALAS